MGQRIPRRLACQITGKWTVYRLLRIPSWGPMREPWMAVAPGKAYGRRFATQVEAFAYARQQAVVHAEESVLLEVCS
jgi:hypothetical protein